MANRVINTILNLRDNMSGGLIRAARNTAGGTREMESATRSVVAFKNRAGSAINSAAKSFVKLGTAAAGVTAALAAKTGLSEAMDLEGYRLQLETATKDTQKASEIMQYAINLANKTPFEGGELVEGAAKFEAMGMAAQKWLPLAGDMAAATNKSFDQATEALIDAQNGELERLKEFGITKAKIVEQGEKMFAGVQLVNNKGQIVNQEKFNEALISLMQERFVGGMEKQATTMKGLWSTVTGVTKSALATITGIATDGSIRSGSALDMLKDKVQLLAGKLEEWQQNGTLDRIAQQFDQGLARGAELASQGFQWLRENGDTLLAVLKPLAGAIVGLKLMKLTTDTVKVVRDFGLFAQTVGLVTKRVLTNGTAWIHNTADMALNKAGLLAHTVATKAAAAGTTLLAGAQKLLNLAFVQTPVGWVVLGIMALVAAGVALYKNWDKVKAKAGELWDGIKTVFGGIKDSIVGAFNSAKEAVGGFFSWIGDKLSALDGAIESVPVIGSIYRGIKGAGSWVIDKVTGHATGTSYFPGGWTRVNERGGEIMRLPGGTQIIPHDVSRRMAGGTTVQVYVTVQGNVIGNQAYAESLGETIAQKLLRALRNS